MLPVDPASIGAERPTQDPMDAIKKAEGTYKDPVEAIPEAQKIAYMPSAPDPTPFTLGGGKK